MHLADATPRVPCCCPCWYSSPSPPPSSFHCGDGAWGPAAPCCLVAALGLWAAAAPTASPKPPPSAEPGWQPEVHSTMPCAAAGSCPSLSGALPPGAPSTSLPSPPAAAPAGAAAPTAAASVTPAAPTHRTASLDGAPGPVATLPATAPPGAAPEAQAAGELAPCALPEALGGTGVLFNMGGRLQLVCEGSMCGPPGSSAWW